MLVVLAVPAWAGASFTGETELQADTPVTLALAVTEEEELGETTRIVVTAPDGFEAIACRATGWDCAVEPPLRMVFTRNPFAFLNSGFELDVHTAAINGTHAFTVTQSNAEGAKKSFFPTVTVVGGQDPAPSSKPSPSPSPKPSPTADSDGTTDTPDTSGDDGGDGTDAGSGDTTDGDGSTDDGADSTSGSTSGSSSGGSTAPRRTQGRSSGSSLEVMPGESSDQDQAAVADPDVAVSPSDGTGSADQDAATVAAGDDPTSGGGSVGGVPWQQWVGGALLLAGATVVGVRRWLIG